MGHLHDDIIYYYDQNPSGFSFLVQIGFCHLNLAGITKFKYEKKNEKDSGHNSKMNPSCKWPIANLGISRRLINLSLTLLLGKEVPVNFLKGAPPVRLAPAGSGLSLCDLAWGCMLMESWPPILVLVWTVCGWRGSVGGLEKGFPSISLGIGSGIFDLRVRKWQRKKSVNNGCSLLSYEINTKLIILSLHPFAKAKNYADQDTLSRNKN